VIRIAEEVRRAGVRAVALEYGKLGRLTLESDFERFHELIRPGNGAAAAPTEADLPPKQ